MDTFRTRQIEPEEQTPELPAEVTGIVEDKTDLEIFTDSSELGKWETANGNYGLEYFGIKEISKEFPLKAQYPYIDKFIKAEMKERGVDSTAENWQNILKEIEGEIGTDKNSYKRIQKLFNYIKTLQKYRDIKRKKDAFRVF